MTIEEFKLTHTVHSYIRSHETDKGDKYVWKCNHPLCNHTILVPKKNRSILLGTMNLCPECEQVQFILTPKHLDRKRPICDVCRSPTLTQEAKNLVDDAMKGLFGTTEENL